MRFKKVGVILAALGILMIAAFQNCGKFDSAGIEKPEIPIEKTSIEIKTAVHLILDE